MSLGVLIRFANSAGTLPAVLEALRTQTAGADEILGVNNGSRDGSDEIVRGAGGRVLDWARPYQASEVLNAGIEAMTSDRILVLSSHTVMTSPHAVERLLAPLADPRVVCSSLRWDDDDYYSDRISFDELRTKGLKFGSIYTNSLGILRRGAWLEQPFREVAGAHWIEDYDWAVLQLKRGGLCASGKVGFEYLRKGGVSRERSQTSYVFAMGREHGLEVRWLGFRAAAQRWALLSVRTAAGRRGEAGDLEEYRTLTARILGRLTFVKC